RRRHQPGEAPGHRPGLAFCHRWRADQSSRRLLVPGAAVPAPGRQALRRDRATHMTETTQRPRTAESAAAVVTEFFDRYRAHDVEGMTDLCSMNAGFSYVPVEIWGKQRVLRAG